MSERSSRGRPRTEISGKSTTGEGGPIGTGFGKRFNVEDNKDRSENFDSVPAGNG